MFLFLYVMIAFLKKINHYNTHTHTHNLSFYVYKTVVFIGSITSRGSKHLPYDLRYDVLTTVL